MPDKFELVFDKDTRILANINIGNNNNGNDQATQIIDYMKSFLGEPFDVTRGMTDIKQFMWLCNDLDIRGSKYRGSHNYIVSIKFTSLPSSKNPVRKENKSSKALINQSSDLKSFESSFR